MLFKLQLVTMYPEISVGPNPILHISTRLKPTPKPTATSAAQYDLTSSPSVTVSGPIVTLELSIVSLRPHMWLTLSAHHLWDQMNANYTILNHTKPLLTKICTNFALKRPHHFLRHRHFY